MAKIKVAIIDDEVEYVNDLAKGLEILGYEVAKAASGSSGIEMINRVKPSVVLCDYKLDDMDGVQVIEETKAANPDTVYIMVTAYYDESYESLFKKSGAAEIIYKPIDITKVDSVIQKALHKAGGAM